MCIMKSYETRGRTVVEPPPRRGNYTSHPPAGVMRLPREWRRSESYSDDGRYVEYRRSQPRAIEYIEEPRRSTHAHRARSVSRRRISEVEVRDPRGSYVDERQVRRSVSRVRY
ncbi:hypothetical protein DE146DRAFT_645013 [Phaeosphaeria sp. MPI-PUGE-AT-0046c]|nr:hypothetical protein DE146DRAFT_645013 [Phaeosphaeria sp. MPI-PUGE-AT-0046c]